MLNWSSPIIAVDDKGQEHEAEVSCPQLVRIRNCHRHSTQSANWTACFTDPDGNIASPETARKKYKRVVNVSKVCIACDKR